MSEPHASISPQPWHCRASLAALAAVMLTLTLLGGAVATYKVSLVRDVRYVGHADEAAYAEMGRSLAAGRWFNVRHVSVFFVPYDPGIERREDHWPPFMGMAIAPFIALLGVEAWAAKLPAILFASIGLPLATAALGAALSRRAYVGLIAGLCMLADVTIFTESLKTLSDVTLAMLVTAWLACLVGARGGVAATDRLPRGLLHILAGVCAAAAFYAKGSHIILIGLWPAASLLIEGWRVLVRPWLYAGMGVAVVLMSPWLIANWIDYGRPLHSTQNYVSGYIALDNWEHRFYRPHWGRDLPQVSDRWTRDPEAFEKLVARQREAFTRWALLGPRARPTQWYDLGVAGAMAYDWLKPEEEEPLRRRRRASEPEPREPGWRPAAWSDPVATWCGVVGVATIAGAALAAAAHGVWWCVTRLRRRPVPASPEPMLLGPVAALVMVALVQWAFVVYLWEAMPRLALVMLPTLAALAATGVSRVIESPMRWWPRLRGPLQRWHWIAAPPLCLLAIVLCWRHVPELKAYHAGEVNLGAYPYRDNAFYPDMGAWLTAHAPDAVVMCRRPWQLRFAAADSVKCVGLPYAPPGVILWIARYYGVTHYLDDEGRPGMHRWLYGRHPGLVPVTDSLPPGAHGKLYRIDWDRIAPDELQPPHDGAVLP
jgi:4-amino-4-deoxy-L-arabinose transferase-like glycosyltransferase